MFRCVLCGIEVESLDGFEIVRIDNKQTIVTKDGMAHSFKKVRGFSKVNSDIARMVNHVRFHTKRNIVNPNCLLCQKGE